MYIAGQLLVVRGLDGGGQVDEIGLDRTCRWRIGSKTVTSRPSSAFGHHRFVVQGVPDEDHAQFPGLFVEQFPLAVGPDVPVEDVYVGVRILLLDGDGLRNGRGAADPRAVGPVVVPRAHALDKHDAVGIFQPARGRAPGRASGSRSDVSRRGIRPCSVACRAGGDDGDAVLDGLVSPPAAITWVSKLPTNPEASVTSAFEQHVDLAGGSRPCRRDRRETPDTSWPCQVLDTSLARARPAPAIFSTMVAGKPWSARLRAAVMPATPPPMTRADLFTSTASIA